jgi:D-alanyl-D-alanine-carboxypeptidase/D-alanyl-D-alanine-endopeptidase
MKTGSVLQLCVAVLLSGASATHAAESPADPLAEGVRKAAAALPAGGIVAAEIDHGSVRFSSAGNFAPHEGVPPERVLFEIGSITKVFTGLLLAEAVLEGKARLDDPIAKYLPADLKLAPAVAAITLEQLATHTSGLPRLPNNMKPADSLDPYADYGHAEMYAFLAAYAPAKPAPQPADYSNIGMGLLGHILERVHGRSYAELVAERITGPLSMKDTVIELDPDQQARFAVPHSGSTTVKPWRIPGLTGAGALRSTATDLVRFAQALMNPDDSPLRAAWELARQPRADMGGEKIGLGIMVGKHNGALTYSHGGGTGGFRSYLEFSPETQRGLVVLIDNDAREGASIAAALSQPPAGAASPGERAETPLPPEQAADYVGAYALDARARFTVLPGEAGHLQIRLTGQPFLPVFFAGADRFFARAVQAEFQFNRDAGGRVISLTLFQNGREIAAKRVDEPLPTVLPTTDAELQDYIGSYDVPPGARFEITVRRSTLFAKLAAQPAFPVFKDRADHFAYDVVEAELTFERGADGKVTALVLHQNGRDLRAIRAVP